MVRRRGEGKPALSQAEQGGSMLDDWQDMDSAPRDGRTLNLMCRKPPGASDPRDFECTGRFVGAGWLGLDPKSNTGNGGTVQPFKWRPIQA